MFDRKRWVTVLAPVAMLAACSGGDASMADIVRDISNEAGTETFARIEVTKDEDGLDVSAVTASDDGTLQEFSQSPFRDDLADLGDPTITYVADKFSIDQIDLDSFEAGLAEVKECDRPRGTIYAIGDHIIESYRCGFFDAPQSRIDGTWDTRLAPGDFDGALDQLAHDIELTGAQSITTAGVYLSTEEAWTSLHVSEPLLPTTTGEECPVLINHAMGGLDIGCEEAEQSYPTETLDHEAMRRIWETEGSPQTNWSLELITEEETLWHTSGPAGRNTYHLDGTPAGN